MEIAPFVFSGTPRILFGAGRFSELPALASSFGKNVLLVTGRSSFATSGRAGLLYAALEEAGMKHFTLPVAGEPSPELVDRAASEFGKRSIHLVIAVGGGSVIDAGKAVSAMLAEGGPVYDYLEGVGKRKPSGIKAPFIAVPTTSGTGSEATKNAVLSRVGRDGFKKSLRHDAYVPDVALVDPELALGCPPDLTAACAMDALSQLLESFVSPKANPVSDALARSGLTAVGENLLRACEDGLRDLEARTGMAYASLMSGITLAQAGLGTVHGIAGPLGGLFPLPHGVACGTLLGAVVRATIRRLRETGANDARALGKFAEAGRLITSCPKGDADFCADLLAGTIDEWTERLKIPRLGAFGVREEDLDPIVKVCDNKSNPVELTPGEMREILNSRL